MQLQRAGYRDYLRAAQTHRCQRRGEDAQRLVQFPIAIPAWKLFAALICGNTVILKPSSDTPACAAATVVVMAASSSRAS